MTMKALILAAGYGTRLAAVAKDTPKPLLTVAGQALIDHVVDLLQDAAEITEIVVVTNNKFYGHFTRWAEANKGKTPIRIVNDGTNTPDDRLGSVGDINFVWKNEKTQDDWLIIGGDNLFDQGLGAYLALCRAKSPSVTIGLYDIHDIKAATKFGVCAVDGQGKVTALLEKPRDPPSSLIGMCLYYFPRQTLAYIDEYQAQNGALDAAGSYIQWLVEKKSVYGFQFSGKWYDIGSIESLNEAQEHFK